MIITNKDKLFHAERDHLLNLTTADYATQYADILSILKESIPFVEVDMLKHTRFTVIAFIQRVQTGVERGDVTDIGTLRINGNVDYKTFSQILDCADGDFTVADDKQFKCKVVLKYSLVGQSLTVEFDYKTTAHDFQFKEY